MKLNILYQEFKYWYKESITDSNIPNKPVFKEYMEKKFGKHGTGKKAGWAGMKFIDNDESDDDFDDF